MLKTKSIRCRVTSRTKRRLNDIVRYYHRQEIPRATLTSVVEDLIDNKFEEIQKVVKSEKGKAK